MNAIAGFWSLGGARQPESNCRKMLQALRSREESDIVLSSFSGISLGRSKAGTSGDHAGDQGPIRGKRFGLVADLRLDNRADLARALDADADPAGRCGDSDLLALALQRWGDAGVDRLIGDFSFAFYDDDERRLVLVRDPLGQRPLLWHQGPGFFAFASMPRGLHALAEVDRAPDIHALARFMALLPREGANSYYRNVQRVMPGHMLVVTPAGMVSRRYWEPRRHELRLGSFANYVEAFRSELDEAVRCRLRAAGATVATHLSAGWDSSAVTATAARLQQQGGRILAYTAVPSRSSRSESPSNRFGDEGPLAAETAHLYANVDHRIVEGSLRSPIRDLPDYFAAFERPPFNLTNHPWLSDIRTAARADGAHVLLTGEIGNWTISASPSTILTDFVREGRWLDWAREASGMLRHRRARVRGIAASSFSPWLPTGFRKAISRFSSTGALDFTSALHPDLQPAAAEAQADYNFGASAHPKSNFERVRAALFEMDFGEYRKGILDRWGIDKRDATADVRLIDFCLSLPVDLLIKGGERRPLARAALSDRLPRAVLEERRKGYQASDWHLALTADLPRISDLIETIGRHPVAGSLVDVAVLRRWIRDWPSGNWHSPWIITRYRTALPQALAAGSFAIHASA